MDEKELATMHESHAHYTVIVHQVEEHWIPETRKIWNSVDEFLDD